MTMKKMLRPLFGLCAILSVFGHADAQCPAGRYEYNYLFNSYTVTTDTYSTANSTTLLVDIYQPVGDSIAARPLIVLAHGGSFVTGTRNDDVTIDSLCVHFARRGYVTASIDYRLGDPLGMITDSTVAITEVMQAISDGKAAVRYFVKDRSTVNKYRIDTNNIYVGGNSAGAVLYMHVCYIDSVGECPTDIQTTMAANGGFEGNSGNAGYTTKFKAVINLAGALNEVGFVSPGDKPSVNAQGDADSTVPYHCADPNIGGAHIHVNLCGLGELEPRYDSLGIYHMSHVFPGQGHVPWSSDAGMFVTVDSMVQTFLYSFVCAPTAVREVAAAASPKIFPNPAHNMVNVEWTTPIDNVQLVDMFGRQVRRLSLGGVSNTSIDVLGLPTGIYFLRITSTAGAVATAKLELE